MLARSKFMDKRDFAAFLRPGAFLALLVGFFALATPVRAAPELTLMIDQPVQVFASAGSTVIFTGTVTNNTGFDLDAAFDLFLNFNSYDPSALSFTQLLGAPDFLLPNGATSPDVELFAALVDPSATSAGSPYLADVTVSDSNGFVSDPVTIGITVPEPGSLWLLVAAFSMTAGFAGRGAYLRWLRRGLFPLAAVAVALAATAAQAATTPVSLYAASAGVSVWSTDNTQVGVQFQIANNGTADADNVVVKSVTVQGGSVSANSPALPIVLGTIGPGEGAPLNLVITVPQANGTTRYLVTVSGTYTFGPTTYGFSINRALFPNSAGPGPISTVSRTSAANAPPYTGIVFPPSPPPADLGVNNAETPMLIPIGPPTSGPPVVSSPSDDGIPGGSVDITSNPRATGAGTPPDPNAAASADGVVLSTYNLPSGAGISYSTDGGTTFTDVNLTAAVAGRASFFPQDDGGLCCDQVVIFVPDPNRPLFVWLLQYQPVTACATNCGPPVAANATFRITQTNRLRVAWATPADIRTNFNSAWTWADLTATALGATASEWVDYPDLAWSANFVYVMVDHGNSTPGKVFIGRRLAARLSLADMRSGSGTLNWDHVELTGSNGLNKSHFVQQAPNTMVVGSLDNSSTLRIFTLDDNSNTLNNTTVTLNNGIKTAYSSIAPDGIDWLAVSFPGNITGAVYRNRILFQQPPQDEYIFAFDAGADPPGRPQAFVRLETLARSGNNFTVVEEYDIFNTDRAFAMAALARDNTFVTPIVGFTIAMGGGTFGYPQMAVGWQYLFTVYQVTNSNATQSFRSATGAIVSRFGDYLSARWIDGTPGGTDFAAQVYDVILNPVPPGGTATCVAVGCVANPRYVRFGLTAGPGPH
jgi:hypothetical protein